MPRCGPSTGPRRLVALNNVYAHIPDVVGFTEGLRALVADDGWVSIEVQHLLTLVERTQFDTIYHEHFQYYTVLTAQRALASGGLALVDVECSTRTAARYGCGRGPSRWPASRRRPSATSSPRSGGRVAHGGGARRVRRGGVSVA